MATFGNIVSMATMTIVMLLQDCDALVIQRTFTPIPTSISPTTKEALSGSATNNKTVITDVMNKGVLPLEDDVTIIVNDKLSYKEQMVTLHTAVHKIGQPCFRTRQVYDRILSAVGPIPGYDRPSCHQDGTFMPKQCKGQLCHCTAPDGSRLGRYRQQRHFADTMHCSCALDQYGLSLLGAENTFNCNNNGNYQHIQCHRSTCFCTDSRGNILEDTAPVHVSNLRSLNCDPHKKQPTRSQSV